MTSPTVVSDATRHVVRDLAVLVLAVTCTAGVMAGLSLLVGQWA